MSLQEELGLKRGFSILAHEALLNIYYTASFLKKASKDFFKMHNITEVQFNLMMLLFYQAEEQGGLTQVELSKMMLVNKANITSLVDRMEKAHLVARTSTPGDRRYNLIRLTAYGKKLLLDIEDKYHKRIYEIMSEIKDSEQNKLIKILEGIRKNLQ